ncbi:MAG: GNAT family N-acetyltransferase [Gemmatimonas sp.]
MNNSLHIRIDDLSGPEVQALLREHLANMHELTPAEHVYALDLDRLRDARITFWTAWDGAMLMGCGALREIDATSGEIKSMRTPDVARRRGAGRAILSHIIETARGRGYQQLYLETGGHPAFMPAWRLYESAGFEKCGAFGDYRAGENNLFMKLELGAR